MASFPDSLEPTESTHPFEDQDGYVSVEGFSNFTESERVTESDIFNDAVLESNANGEQQHQQQDEDDEDEDDDEEEEDNGVFVDSNGPVLGPPDEMLEEGLALRQWRRQNAIELEEKEKREKAILSQIIEEATKYKVDFHEKRKVTCENNKTNNREKEKLFLENHDKFHKEADKNYWKSIAELIPNEVPTIEKRRGKKDQEKKPSIAVIQGPKPGKPTDLARMRQILVKLKHETPTHLKLGSLSADTKPSGPNTEPTKPTTVETTPEAIVAA